MRYYIPLLLVAALLMGCKNQPSGGGSEPASDSLAVSSAQAASDIQTPTDLPIASGVKFNPDAQVFTVLYAISDDYFVNVREVANAKSAILDTINGMFHGIGDGVLIEKGEKWDKVRGASGKVGYSNNKFLGYMTWYEASGAPVMIAARDNTPIYGENYADEGDYPVFCTVAKGTILADYNFESIEGYYSLLSGHDYLFLAKDDVIFVQP